MMPTNSAVPRNPTMALGFICSSGLSSLNNGVDLTAGFLSESITLCSPHYVAQRIIHTSSYELAVNGAQLLLRKLILWRML